jgi:uncharacterized protein YbaA (DUF1428 family)
MQKIGYVDGFVFVVKKGKNTAAYKKMIVEAKEVWTRFGALDYKECMIDDSNPAKSSYTFGTMTKAKGDEVVWFSYVAYKDKVHRNQVNKKVMAHFAKKYGDKSMKDMPFDMKRMAYAGFKVMVG